MKHMNTTTCLHTFKINTWYNTAVIYIHTYIEGVDVVEWSRALAK